jgi:hypothetical protein
MFLYTLTAPTLVINAITLTAFKKYVLVSLIHNGRATVLYSPILLACSLVSLERLLNGKLWKTVLLCYEAHADCHAGSLLGLPKYTSQVVSRSCKSECAAYYEFAGAYSKSDADVQRTLTAHSQTFKNVRALSFQPEFASTT